MKKKRSIYFCKPWVLHLSGDPWGQSVLGVTVSEMLHLSVQIICLVLSGTLQENHVRVVCVYVGCFGGINFDFKQLYRMFL